MFWKLTILIIASISSLVYVTGTNLCTCTGSILIHHSTCLLFQTSQKLPIESLNHLQNLQTVQRGLASIVHCQQIGHFQNKGPTLLKTRLRGMLAKMRCSVLDDHYLLPAQACEHVWFVFLKTIPYFLSFIHFIKGKPSSSLLLS